jgi:hypothetical protein
MSSHIFPVFLQILTFTCKYSFSLISIDIFLTDDEFPVYGIILIVVGIALLLVGVVAAAVIACAYGC